MSELLTAARQPRIIKSYAAALALLALSAAVTIGPLAPYGPSQPAAWAWVVGIGTGAFGASAITMLLQRTEVPADE
jgi:hypothetical protein